METRNYRQIEAEFFRSLDHLCNLYEVPQPDVTAYVYPQNVALTYAEVSAAVRRKDGNANCIIMKDERHRSTLAVLKTYDTGRCLYYIPVRPVWNLVRSEQQKPLAELLLSIFSYLYQVANIPFYADNGSYMDCQYHTLQNWIDEAEDESEEDRQYQDDQNAELEKLRDAGDRILTIIRDKGYLNRFEVNIEAYRITENASDAILALADQYLTLYTEYPGNSLFDNIRDDLIEPEETERIRGEQYISFYWSGNDCFYDMLFDMVNNDFQECGVTDEPVAIQLFDSPQTTMVNNLDFENRLFELIDKLCELLNPYDHD